MVLNKGFIFDRDGVLNDLVADGDNLRPPWQMSELKINYDVKILIDYLRKKQYKLFIVSNQPDVSRNNLDLRTLNKINDKLNAVFQFDEIVVDTTDSINFKKPSPFMVNKLIDKYFLDKKSTWLIGDRWVDILTAKNADINSILLKREYSFNKTSIGKAPKNLNAKVNVRTVEEIFNLDFL